jgi:hypothetical protein
MEVMLHGQLLKDVFHFWIKLERRWRWVEKIPAEDGPGLCGYIGQPALWVAGHYTQQKNMQVGSKSALINCLISEYVGTTITGWIC